MCSTLAELKHLQGGTQLIPVLCPLHPSPQNGHEVGLVVEQGEIISPEGLAWSLSHPACALLGSASLNTTPITSSARGGCGGSGRGPGAASLLGHGADHGLPCPMLDTLANSWLSAGLQVIY